MKKINAIVIASALGLVTATSFAATATPATPATPAKAVHHVKKHHHKVHKSANAKKVVKKAEAKKTN